MGSASLPRSPGIAYRQNGSFLLVSEYGATSSDDSAFTLASHSTHRAAAGPHSTAQRQVAPRPTGHRRRSRDGTRTLALTACAPAALDVDEAVAVARPLSTDLAAAAENANLDYRTREDVERLEWFNGVCEYHAPAIDVGTPIGNRTDDPTLMNIIAVFDPVLIEHGAQPFNEPEQIHGLIVATAHSEHGLTVSLSTGGSLSIIHPVALDEDACTDDALPTG